MAGISREVIERRMRELEAGKNPKNKAEDNVFLKLAPNTPTALRVIPLKNGDFSVKGPMHYGIGRMAFLCPKRNFNEDCPVCEYATSLWNQGSKNNDADAVAMAKRYFVKQRFYSCVMVRGKELEGPKIWGYSEKVHNKLWAFVEDFVAGDPSEDIFDTEVGYDLTVNSIPKGNTSITETEITVSRKPSKLSSDGAEALIDSLPRIEDHLLRKTSSEVQQILNKACLGDTEVDVTEDKEKYGTPQTKEKEKSSVDKALAELDNTLND